MFLILVLVLILANPSQAATPVVSISASISPNVIEAGSSKNQILQMRVYISNIELWSKVNERYSAFFGDHKPVRSIVPTRDLHFGCLIEIEATAVLL